MQSMDLPGLTEVSARVEGDFPLPLAGAGRGGRAGFEDRRRADTPTPNPLPARGGLYRLSPRRGASWVHETYIVAQTRDGMVIVDQHAAHERLVYERMKREMADGGVARQTLLLPGRRPRPRRGRARWSPAPRSWRVSASSSKASAPARCWCARPRPAGQDRRRRPGPRHRRRPGRERRGPGPEGAAGGGLLDHGLPRQRPRRSPAEQPR
jgi:hypothetical protein